MTLADFQPYVERAVTAFEWATARARWRRGLIEEREAIEKALPLAGSFGVEREPLEARLRQIENDLAGDVTADQVSVSPLRSVPMDMITTAVVRRLLRLPTDFPVLSIKELPSEEQVTEAVAAIAQRWGTPLGELVSSL